MMKEKKEKLLNKKKKKKFWTQKWKKISKPLPRLEKDLSLMFPYLLGKINLEKLINWINELEEYFEYEEIEDLDRLKFAKAKLKGHAKI